jgi:ribulose-phosphate 3-epimerase
LPLALDKIVELGRRRAEKGLDFLIEVDGGMSPETAPLAVKAGADVLVCGASSIFLKGQPLTASVRAMRESLAR